MSRKWRRIILWAIGGLFGLIVIAVVAVLIVVQTAWFRNYVHDKIIAYAEETTGGTVDLQAFNFDWTHLHATLTRFVLHGTEPQGSAPLFSAKTIDVYLTLLSGVKHIVELNYLGVDTPQVNVIVYPDGHTNVPSPKVKRPSSNTTVLEDVVNLAIRRFNIQNGLIQFAQQKSEFSARGENLRAQLSYNVVASTYDGQLSMAPLYLRSGGRPPLDVKVTLPLHLERDKIQLNNAQIASGASQIVVNGEMDHLVDPHTSAHLNAQISLVDVKKAAGASIPIDIPKNGPGILDAEATVSMDKDHIRIEGARMALGSSNIEASGTLKDPSNQPAAQIKAKLVLGELARLYKNDFNPRGTVLLNANAKLIGPNNDYDVNGNIEAKNLSFTESGTRVENVNFYSAISANPRDIELKGLRLAAFGGTFSGNAGIQNMARYHLDGRLSGFDIAELARVAAHERVGYGGVISGPVEASGDLKNASDLKANVHLAIAPGRRGVPVSGRLNAAYNGATGAIDLARSYVALPHSRLDLSGSLGRQVQVKLVSRDPNDFLPAMNIGAKTPVTTMPLALQSGGAATFTGAVAGKLAAPHVTGHVAVNRFKVEDRPFDNFAADLNASPSGATVQNAALTRGTLQAHFAATVGLRNWKALPSEPLSANASIVNADLADIMALAGEKTSDFKGTLNADARIGGTIGNPTGVANLNVANLTAYDEHFDQLAGQVNFSDRLITVPDMRLISGQNRIDLKATYEHAADSLENGRLQVNVASNTMQLAQFQAVKKGTPEFSGTLQVNADATANIAKVKDQTEFQLVAVNANVAAHGMQYEGKSYGDFTAIAHTSGSTVNYNVASDFAGSNIRATGQTRLERDYPTTANLSISNLQIERVLAVAGRKDIPFTGILSTNAQLSGTLQDPHANADLRVTNANYHEHFDLIQGHLNYSNTLVEIPSLEIVSGSARAQLAATFVPNPPKQFETGALRFKLSTNRIQLAQFKILQDYRPGIAGTLEISANGAATLQNAAGKPRILFSTLDANASATGLAMNKKPYGDIRLTANTRGNDLLFNLNSDFANSKIQGNGRIALSGDYPIAADLTVANLRYSNLRDWIGTNSTIQQQQFDIITDASASLSGPLTKTGDLKASLRIPRLEMTAKPRGVVAAGTKNLVLHNEGPIVASLDRSVVRVDSAHIVGPNTDVSVTGTATLQPKQDLNLNINATTDLAIAQEFSHDIYSSGAVVLQASIRGPVNDPVMNGRLQLKNAAFNLIDAPNGISNANGLIVFNGKTATIQSFTGESGGGQVTAGGSVTYAGGAMQFKLTAGAAGVRIRYPEGMSTTADARIQLTGSSDNSTVAGTITIDKIDFNPRSDFGSILSSSATPVQTPTAPSPFLANMHLQIQVRTSPIVAFQTSLAQNLQVTANLRVRGTAAEPGVLGRVNITQGTLVFFGTKYNVNEGTISFYNPVKIEPILNINLETNVQGIDVILTVSGPADNMTLTHRSDPPLPFRELVALLATGKAPTSDPTLAARQPAAPPQSLEQMGESALLGQAVANPIANRLQRVFGVSQLKIAPAFVSGSELPQARLTLEQQVTHNLTFTYITDLTNANEQVIRIEWAINKTWSAVATRDENGLFGIDFLYKRRFK